MKMKKGVFQEQRSNLSNLLIMGSRKKGDDHHHQSSLSGFQGDNCLRPFATWRRRVASRHNLQGEITRKDMVDTNESSNHTSPSFLDDISCIKHCKRLRCKMDNITFDHHLENIWKSFSEDKRSSFAIVNSLCFSLYQTKTSIGVNMIRKNGIFSKKYIFVPIVCWDHWRLVIFCHFGEAAHSKTRTQCILLLDSMEMGAQLIVPDVRKFVFEIFEAEGRAEMKDVIYRIPLLVPKVPQQRNGVDCGRYVLYFIRLFLDNAPDNFSISNGYPYFMKPSWFTHESFEDFCDGLEKEYPTPMQGTSFMRRRSQRIRKLPRVKQDIEVVSSDDED